MINSKSNNTSRSSRSSEPVSKSSKSNDAASPTIGICLGGGGALGFAHIGVLQALEEQGIVPQIIAGTSMGAIVGVLYAQGISPKQMMQRIHDKKLYKITSILNPSFARSGLSSMRTLRHFLEEEVPENSFEALKKPFSVCVSHLNNGKWEIFNSGNKLHELVVASSSIPFAFEAVHIDGGVYVDGGLYNNVPAQALHEHCDVIIGVDVMPFTVRTNIAGTADMINITLHGLVHHNAKAGRKLCRFLIEPNAISKYNEFSFNKFEDIYNNGYEATVEYIKNNPEIKTLQQ
ncbi:MAG: patatin-like phospholipase family protein [Prevotellaceae bacterium]|jgi:NTE family protein|nr:patatin-like phospholipase family protein [Prevotellaceae bacterium]